VHTLSGNLLLGVNAISGDKLVLSRQHN